jgi:hypothetical protein
VSHSDYSQSSLSIVKLPIRAVRSLANTNRCCGDRRLELLQDTILPVNLHHAATLEEGLRLKQRHMVKNRNAKLMQS